MYSILATWVGGRNLVVDTCFFIHEKRKKRGEKGGGGLKGLHLEKTRKGKGGNLEDFEDEREGGTEGLE